VNVSTDEFHTQQQENNMKQLAINVQLPVIEKEYKPFNIIGKEHYLTQDMIENVNDDKHSLDSNILLATTIFSATEKNEMKTEKPKKKLQETSFAESAQRQKSLTNDAENWFEQNKHRLSSWSTFKMEIEHRFQSSLHKDQKFIRLRERKQQSQGTGQQFIDAMEKLCFQVNPLMLEQQKMLHIKAGMKPSFKEKIFDKTTTIYASTKKHGEKNRGHITLIY
jgi:hypothetical protein